jgi:signal transduction histidine kinase
MNKLNQLFQRVTHIGVKENMSLAEQAKIIKLNKAYLLSVPACVLDSLVGADSPSYVLITSIIGSLFLFSLLFHHLGKYDFAGFYSNFMFGLLCAILAICFNGELGSEYYIFVALFVIQLQFYQSKSHYAAILTLISFVLFLSCKIINHFPHWHLPIPKYAFAIQVQNIVMVFLFLIYLMYEYRNLILTYQQEIEKQNKALAEQKAALLDSNQIKNQLFSIIGHDLNKPLASVKGMITLLSGKLLTEEEESKYLKKLENMLDSADLTLKNLLEWGMQHQKEQKLEITSISVYVAQNIRLLLANAEQKNIKVVNEVSENVFVFVDKHQLSFVLRNLIANAIKFTHLGGEICIFTREIGDYWEICVRDNGIGIKSEYLSQLFNMNKRFSTLGTASESGTGLGLPLCKQFVEVNGGLLNIWSEEEKGSIFSFTLPKK